MTYVVIRTRVAVNCGDHAQDVTSVHEVPPGETVDALVERLLKGDRRWITGDRTDYLTIYPVNEASSSEVGNE